MRISDWSSDVCSSDLGHLKPLLERLEHILVERLLEGHYHRGKLLGIGPFPGAEFRVLRLDVHILVAAGEAAEEPGLALAAPLALPHLADEIVREVVGELDRAAAKSEEHTSERQSIMRTSSAVFCLKKK